MNKEMEPFQKTTVTILQKYHKLAPKYSYSMQSFHKFQEWNESLCLNYSTLTRAALEKESCVMKISTETEDFQLNYKCTESEKMWKWEMQQNVILQDTAKQSLKLTDILKRNEQEIDLRFIDCNISEFLTYPTLQLTFLKITRH